MANAPNPPAATDAELDELLDDAFEQFTNAAPKSEAKKEPTSAVADSTLRPATSSAAAAATEGSAAKFDEEFTRLLAESMESLLKDSSALTGADGASAGSDEQKSALDQLLKQMAALQSDLGTKDQASAPESSSESSKTKAADGVKPLLASSPSPAPSSFQDKIKATMDKLKESADSADADTAQSLGGGDIGMMDELMRQMDQMGDDSQLDSLVDDVISQLMSKDVLQQPLKELDREYPKYLEKNKSTLSNEDRERYQKQHEYVKQILAMFAETTDDAANDPRIVDLMQKMQDCGQPPNELLKILAPDMELDEKGEVKVPEAPPNCIVM
ncbi:Peroxisome chaperone and import receptor [Coemansia aciculifera]|nr:Peroxisome chaperone and import receptor [Coemansia aciculifera]